MNALTKRITSVTCLLLLLSMPSRDLALLHPADAQNELPTPLISSIKNSSGALSTHVGDTWYTNTARPQITVGTERGTSIPSSSTLSYQTNNDSPSTFSGALLSLQSDLSIGSNSLVLNVLNEGISTNSASTIVYDNEAPSINGELQVQSYKEKVQPENVVTFSLPEATDGLTYVDHMSFQLAADSSAEVLSLSQKLIETTSISLSPDGTSALITPVGQTWPTELSLKNLDKKNATKTLVYKATLNAVDAAGNTSAKKELLGISFDTTAPKVTSAFELGTQPPQLINGKEWTISKNSTIPFSLSIAYDTTNSRTKKLPMTLRAFAGTPKPIKEVSSFLFSKSYEFEGPITDSLTLPSGFQDEITFVLIDSAGNEQLIATRSCIVDNTPPSALTEPGIRQIFGSNNTATKDLTLKFSISDNIALSPLIDLSYGSIKRSYTIPESLLRDPKVFSNTLTIPHSYLTGFPGGENTTLSVRIYDIAGNSYEAKEIMTQIDTMSPLVSNISYDFDSKDQLDLAFDVNDTSPLSIQLTSDELLKESFYKTNPRRVHLSNVVIAGKATPLVFNVDDHINAPTVIMVDRTMALTKGSRTIENTIPLTYMLINNSGANTQVSMEITGMTLPTAITQNFTGLTGTLQLSTVPIGNYTIKTTVTAPGKTPRISSFPLRISEDIITPSIKDVSLTASPSNKTLYYDENTKKYFTNAQELLLRFSFLPIAEESYPISLKINGKTIKSFLSQPTDTQSVPFSLVRPNMAQEYTIECSDAAGNSFVQVLTINEDTLAPTLQDTISVYNGKTGVPSLDKENLLQKSLISDEYLTQNKLALISISTTDTWGKAPKISIRKGDEIIVTATDMVPAEGNIFTFQKGDLSLEANKLNSFSLEITDIAGNTRAYPLKIRNSIEGPKIVSMSIANNHAQTNTALVPITITAQGAGALNYIVYSDTIALSSGALLSETTTLHIPLTKIGENTLTVKITDQLGSSQTSHPAMILFEPENSLFTHFSLPWQKESSVQSLKATLISTNNTVYSAELPKTSTFTLNDLLSRVPSFTSKKIPIGTYTLVLEALGEKASTSTPLTTHITVTPYYFDAKGDMNGDGRNAGISDQKIFLDALFHNAVYDIKKLTALNEQELLLQQQLKERAAQIRDLLNTSADSTTQSFLKN